MIVIVSFIADTVLLVVFPSYSTRDFVFILAFLLPWRVIRVVDSKFTTLNQSISFHESIKLFKLLLHIVKMAIYWLLKKILIVDDTITLIRSVIRFDFWCLKPLSAIFQLYHVIRYRTDNQMTQKRTTTMVHKSIQNYKLNNT